MSIDVPSADELTELTQHRHPGCLSFYVAPGWPGSSDARPPIGRDPEAARLALRSAARSALAELAAADVDRADRERVGEALRSLEDDPDLWSTEARTIAVFVSPERTRTFRLMNELPQHTAVGDRFDVGPLVRAITFDHRGYVLALTQGDVRLLFLGPDASSHRVELSTLPTDAAEALARTTTGGRFDRQRAEGALGPKIEQRRYCSIVQDAVLAAIRPVQAPVVLAAAADLGTAYREVSTYQGLLEQGIDANPTSLSSEDLEARARAVLDAHHDAQITAWRERLGALSANGRGSTQLSDVARAATAGLVDTLLFDLGSDAEGSIDETGAVTFADGAGPASYGLVDEIAARVLRTGGTVKAVRRADLPDDSPVAATFRFGS